METLRTIREQNREIFTKEEYDVFVDVYEKREEAGEQSLQFVVSEAFQDIYDANTYIKEQDAANKHFDIKLEKEIQIDGLRRNVLNFQSLKASVNVDLVGFHLHINTDMMISVNRLEGCRWNENTNGRFVSGVSNIKIAKGKTLNISAQEKGENTSAIEVSYVNFDAENANMILGSVQKNMHTNFYKVSFETPLKNLDIYGSFHYIKPWKSEDKSLEVLDTFKVYNRNEEAAIYAPMKVNKLELDGNLSVIDLQSSGLFSVNNISRFCILSGGRAELTNVKIKEINKEDRIPFTIIMEQAVSLGKYNDYFVEDWENIFEKKEAVSLEDYFEDIKLLSARGILEISGKINFVENRTLPILLEKHFCWEAGRRDNKGKASFSYPVDFFKETSLEKGETIAILPKQTVNAFSVSDKDTCLKQYKDRVKAVASAIVVLREGTEFKAEYTSLQEAVGSLQSDFGIEKNEVGNFIFIFKTDHVLSGNVVFPKFVKSVQFVTELLEKQNGCLVRRLDLNGYSLSMSGFLNLNAGLEIISQRKTGTINLTGKQGNTGMNIFVRGNYFLTPEQPYDNSVFYLLQNVNVLSAGGSIVAGGRIPGGIDGSISAYECVIDSNIWKINEITAAKLFIASEREESISEQVAYLTEEGRLQCDKINVTGKLIIEWMKKEELSEDTAVEDRDTGFAIDEKIRCNVLMAKCMEMYNGMVRVLKTAQITDLFLFYDNPTLQVEGTVFDIKGKVICGAGNARFLTGVKEEKKTGKKRQSALRIDGEVKIIQDERYGITGDKITVSVLANDEIVDLRKNISIKNVLLKASKANETVFLLDECNGNAFDIQQMDGDSYVLKKTGDKVEVLGGDEVTVALYKKTADDRLINYYKDINDAVGAIDDIKDKNADYVILLIRNIGDEESKSTFRLPRFANNVTFVSREYNTIYSNKSLAQNTNIKLKNVRLESDSDYVAGKYKLELENSGFEVADLRVKDFRVVHSDIEVSGKASLGNLYLLKSADGLNASVVTAYNRLQVDNIVGEGELAVYNAYTTKTWKKAVSQMSMKGEISDQVLLDLRPCFYDKEKNAYTSFLNEEGMFDEETFGRQSEEFMVTGNEIPAVFKKVLSAKNLSYVNPISYYGMSHEKVWPMKYKDGIYFTNVPNVIFVDILHPAGRETIGEFRGWEEAVKAIDSRGDTEGEYIIHVSDNIGAGLDTPLKKMLLPSKAKRVIIEGNGSNGIIMTNTQINLKTDVVFSNIFIAAVKKGKKGYESAPYSVEVGKHYLLLQNMLSELEDEKTGFVYKSLMKIWGNKHSVVETLYVGNMEEETEVEETEVTEEETEVEKTEVTEEETEVEETEVTEEETEVEETDVTEEITEVEKAEVTEEVITEVTKSEMKHSRKREKRSNAISEISNVGKVFLHTVIPVEDSEVVSCYEMKYMVKGGIIGVEELTLDKGVMLDCNRKDIFVKNLIMGADEGNTIREDMRSRIYAANITVYDKTIMKDSDLNAGSNKVKDGNIKLNRVAYLNDDNHIIGKNDKKGRSLVSIKGQVSRPGNNIWNEKEQETDKELDKKEKTKSASLFSKKEKQKKLEKVPRKKKEKKTVERIKREKTKKSGFLKKNKERDFFKGTEDKL